MKRTLTITMLITATSAFADNTNPQNPPSSNQQSSQQNNSMKKLDKCPGNPNADCRPQEELAQKKMGSHNNQQPREKK